LAALTLYEELENVLTNRLKNALRTGEVINAPDWVSAIAECMALAVTLPDASEVGRLRLHAHDELNRFINERLADKEREKNG
jgi:hypothetical protein